MHEDLDPKAVHRKSGTEPFCLGDEPLGFGVQSFWQWAFSDLLNNTTRGLIAEYLVAYALGDPTPVRTEWAPFDVVTPRGIRVEVKASAYVQRWAQKQPSLIRFRIMPTRSWDAVANAWTAERKRQADVYVFCLLHRKERQTANPLDVAQWTFFVIATTRLDDALGDQQTIGLRTLRQLGAAEVTYAQLRAEVNRAAGESGA